MEYLFSYQDLHFPETVLLISKDDTKMIFLHIHYSIQGQFNSQS